MLPLGIYARTGKQIAVRAVRTAIQSYSGIRDVQDVGLVGKESESHLTITAWKVDTHTTYSKTLRTLTLQQFIGNESSRKLQILCRSITICRRGTAVSQMRIFCDLLVEFNVTSSNN